jgi:hypothetical protein
MLWTGAPSTPQHPELNDRQGYPESFSLIPRSSLVGGNLTRTVTVVELKLSRAGNPQLIDVRSPSGFASGHIPGAINIPLDQIESRIADLSSTTPIVLI